jgi:D-alanine-D-alanine ligase
MAYKKIQKHIEIARSAIPELSSMGQDSCDMLVDFLKTRYQTVGVTMVKSADDLRGLVAKHPDLVFTVFKYTLDAAGEPVWISEYLEAHGIAHTGSSHAAIKLEQNKAMAKKRIQDAGLMTAPSFVVEQGRVLTRARVKIPYPLFVKPNDLGGNKGVDEDSVVYTLEALNAKIASIHQTFGTDALVEQYLSGHDFCIGMLRQEESSHITAMPVQMPSLRVLDPILKMRLTDLAQSAFAAVGARDYGSIDIRLDAHGTPHFIEANLIPCLIRGRGLPKSSFMNLGMDYEALIMRIVRLGLERVESNELADNSIGLVLRPQTV